MNECDVSVVKLREPLFDVVKALMMVWVVWGHLGLYGIVAYAPSSTHCMANAKIAMNMPVFFVISGYLAISAFSGGGWPKILSRSVCFLWPRVVFGLACALFVRCFAGQGFWGVYHTIQTFWFLHTLAIVYLISAVIYRFGRTDTVRWLGFAVAYAFLWLLPARFSAWWMGQVLHMFPYFVFGLMVLRRHEWHKRTLVGIACGVALFLVVVFEGDSSSNGMNFWCVTTHYRTVLTDSRAFVTFFARPAVGIVGSVFLLWSVRWFLEKAPALRRLAVFGTTSLGVYVIHEWFLLMAGSRCSVFPLPEWTRWFVAIAYFLLCHGIIRLIKRCRVTDRLFFGDERRLTACFGGLFRLVGCECKGACR